MVGSSHARRGFEKKTLVGRAFRVLVPRGCPSGECLLPLAFCTLEEAPKVILKNGGNSSWKRSGAGQAFNGCLSMSGSFLSLPGLGAGTHCAHRSTEGCAGTGS